MAQLKGAHRKLKPLYLMKIFSEETDDEHKLTLPQIAERLAVYGISADRKTLYEDFEELRDFGFDIISCRVKNETFYYLGARDFELSELKLLVDSVQSAKFITDGKSHELIKKLEKLTSTHLASRLQRQVVISGRVKTMNESIYYNVDTLHQAISSNRQIRFHYFQWNLKKEMELRHDGAWYQVSPWALMWDNENYYLVGYDAADSKIKHYRVDKMLDISECEERRSGQESFLSFDMPKYTRSLFGMFGGEETRVTLEVENGMVGILLDRFGKDIPILKTDDDHFKTIVNVAVSSQFLGWIMALGGGVRITGPEYVVERMREETRKIAEQY